MNDFVGRHRELDQLDDQLQRARSGRGGMLWITGRRRVGKSRLVQEFVAREHLPHVFFQAPQRSNAVEHFVDAIATSNLPAAQLVRDGLRPTTWRAALQLASSGATSDTPVTIVIDEYPYLHARDPGVDADFQAVWDAQLERAAVLLICIGSDQSMMERLLEHDRPLHGRPTLHLQLHVLDPHDIRTLLQVDDSAALDAYLVVGGFPALAREWRPGSSLTQHLRRALSSSSTPLVTNGERILNAELAGELNARAVLEAIGLGERSFTKIGERSGVGKATLERSLKALVDKRLVTRRLPLSIPASSTEARYQIVDSGLRFWLRFIGPHLAELERGRSDLVIQRVLDGWNEFRGPSIEPVVREALARLLPNEHLAGAHDVGGYWTRTNDPEIDLVGVDRAPKPRTIEFVGSIKWRSSGSFSDADAAWLVQHRALLPGATDHTLLVGVSRSGFATDRLDVQLGPADIVRAWAPRT